MGASRLLLPDLHPEHAVFWGLTRRVRAVGEKVYLKKMSIVVQKYGGSSVASVDKLRAVASRIAKTVKAGHQVCVVVSAMGSTTDELLAQASKLSSSPSRRELDMLLTCGERASMALLSMAVIEEGLEAISFTGSQCGIMTNDRHSGARIVEVRPFRVEDELARGRVVIVAGFQGVSYKREITTLGRGGTDTTAVALAAALGAEYCEICSDVDGIRTADPRVVSATELLKDITYDDALELTAHGAKVLHAEAVEYARKTGIALWARSTDGSDRGTRVHQRAEPSVTVAAVDIVRLQTKEPGGIPRALSAIGAFALYCHLRENDEEAWITLADVPDWAGLKNALPKTVVTTEELSAVTIVGRLFGGVPDAILAAIEKMKKEKVEVVALHSTPSKISCVVPKAFAAKASQAFHQTFVVERTPFSNDKSSNVTHRKGDEEVV